MLRQEGGEEGSCRSLPCKVETFQNALMNTAVHVAKVYSARPAQMMLRKHSKLKFDPFSADRTADTENINFPQTTVPQIKQKENNKPNYRYIFKIIH